MLHIALMMIAAVTAAGAEPVRLGIFLEAPIGTTPEILESFRNEVGRIVARPGTELLWRHEITGNEAFHRVLVIRLRGACVARQPEQFGAPASLGSTHISNGQVQPFIDVSCGQVITAMSRSWSWPSGQVPAELYGKALARVAAHEVFHALTASVDHDDEGLMKRAFDRHDLCARRLELTPASIARLERSLGLGSRPTD